MVSRGNVEAHFLVLPHRRRLRVQAPFRIRIPRSSMPYFAEVLQVVKPGKLRGVGFLLICCWVMLLVPQKDTRKRRWDRWRVSCMDAYTLAYDAPLRWRCGESQWLARCNVKALSQPLRLSHRGRTQARNMSIKKAKEAKMADMICDK